MHFAHPRDFRSGSRRTESNLKFGESHDRTKSGKQKSKTAAPQSAGRSARAADAALRARRGSHTRGRVFRGPSSGHIHTEFHGAHPGPYGLNVLQIDLNNDGTVDFVLVDESQTCRGGGLDVRLIVRRGIRTWQWRGCSTTVKFAGSDSGMARRLTAVPHLSVTDACLQAATSRPKVTSGTSQNGYLGVKFLINGQVHYGWIGFRSVHGTRRHSMAGPMRRSPTSRFLRACPLRSESWKSNPRCPPQSSLRCARRSRHPCNC